MPSGSTTFHEEEGHLRRETRDMHRALVSLMEELEAIQQRIDAVHLMCVETIAGQCLSPQSVCLLVE